MAYTFFRLNQCVTKDTKKLFSKETSPPSDRFRISLGDSLPGPVFITLFLTSPVCLYTCNFFHQQFDKHCKKKKISLKLWSEKLFPSCKKKVSIKLYS